MNTEQKISVVVEITRTDRREVTFDHHHVTGREIKTAAKVPEHDLLFRFHEGKFHDVPDQEKITIKPAEVFLAVPTGGIPFSVDDEPLWTKEKRLTPKHIMELAGVDPAKNYLVEIRDHEKISFKDDPDKEIHMHSGMKFITCFVGPKPVSNS